MNMSNTYNTVIIDKFNDKGKEKDIPVIMKKN